VAACVGGVPEAESQATEVTLRKGGPDLVLEGVSKAYGDVVAVDTISLEVPRGHFYSLLGPSGCGKTTTLRLVAGFERADTGRILLAGEDITGFPPNRRRVNTVFQHYALFPHLSVEDNVSYGLRQRKLPRSDVAERLDDALKTVRLEDLRRRYPRELSGGQQQRVALARALINRPAVLLLDEPLAALDLKLRKAMQRELKSIQERLGITFLYVTHDQEEALTLSDRIAVMHDGKLLQEGSPSEIYERPRSRFVADFIGQTNFFEGLVESMGESPTVRTSSGLLLRCAPTDLALIDRDVVVSVRPESVRPASDGSPANRIRGSLARHTYLGDIVQYHVEGPDGSQIVMQRQRGQDSVAEGWRLGETVEVGWSETDALILVDDGSKLDPELTPSIEAGTTYRTG
jgi:spermidine/putrescine transport system ATP-binding protein